MIKSKNVIHILKRTLNLVDYRIVDHSERVAYIVNEMLKAEGNHSESELVEACFLCILHDVGAFKTEEIDAMTDQNIAMSFELKNTLPHAVYGYLFINKFSILTNHSDAILYHHTRYDKLMASSCENKDLAAKIFLADRVDILLSRGRKTIDETMFNNYRDTIFSSKEIDLLLRLEKEKEISKNLKEGGYSQKLLELYEKIELTKEQSTAFLRTIIYAIDFRSEFTVMHTITTVSISIEIAKLLGFTGIDSEKIFYGSLLHDIGKIATSVSVLEKEGSLDDFEYNLIKDHVIVSENILRDLVDEEVFKIAVRHHEKQDGSGYPHGLTQKEMTLSQCTVVVADIISALVGKRSYKDAFPEEKVKEILRGMLEEKKLNQQVVKVVLENYALVLSNAKTMCTDAIDNYHTLGTQYKELLSKLIKNT